MIGTLLFASPFIFAFVLVVLARKPYSTRRNSKRHREFMDGPLWER